MIKVRQRGDRIQYDIRFKWPDGTEYRERKNAPVSSKSGAKRWAEDRERELLARGRAAYEVDKAPPVVAPASKVPTLEAFWPTVYRDWYKAQRKKASAIDAADSIFRNHLKPALGGKRCDDILNADVAALKGRLVDAKPKTVNNVLSVLSRTLKCAVKWGVIAAVPCSFDLLKVAPSDFEWYEVHEFRRLVEGARKVGTVGGVHESLLIVLLGGSAGLRLGEIRELKWCDVDLARRQVTIVRNIWRNEVDAPKGWRKRTVPLTDELHAALKEARQRIGSDHVLPGLSIQTVRTRIGQAQRRAGLEETQGVHVLRHTFCSHLAIAGVPAKAIQELAGHQDLKTTLKYMHLSPANRSAAMGALAALYSAGASEEKEKTG